MNKTIKTLSIIAALASLVSCAGKGNNSTVAAGNPNENAVKKVRVVSAEYQDVPQEEIYSSNVQAFVVNNVVPQNGNRISKIYVEVGDFVSKGQVLAEMDRASLIQTKLKLVNDSTELSRLKELYMQGGISASDFETAQMAYDVSKTTYDNLLENTVLRSPLNGVITARNYDAGDMYAMTSPIYVVQQISPVKLFVGISESDYTKVQKGDKVRIEVDALPGRVFEGTVNRLHPTIDASTHTFNVEVVVPNNDRALRPGMFARVKVTFNVNHSIVVPDRAIIKQQGSGQKSVFVLNPDNTVSSKVVILGKHFENYYEILSGLSAGDKVVVNGQSALKNGTNVEVI